MIPPRNFYPSAWGAPEKSAWWTIAKRAVQALKVRRIADTNDEAEKILLLTLNDDLKLDPLSVTSEFLLAIVVSKTDNEWLAVWSVLKAEDEWP